MENNYSRHFQELKKKYISLMTELAQKTYFNEMPLYLDEPLLYVIILNAPFMEEEKRAKYNLYLQKKTVADFKDNVKEFIYPYKNSDKEKLGKGAILILKMDSVDSAKKAASALNGVYFLKSNQVTAMTYPEYEKITNLPRKYEEKKQLEFENVNQWEKSNFTEMLLVESKDKITIGAIHFLKKTFTVNYTLPNNKEINFPPKSSLSSKNLTSWTLSPFLYDKSEVVIEILLYLNFSNILIISLYVISISYNFIRYSFFFTQINSMFSSFTLSIPETNSCRSNIYHFFISPISCTFTILIPVCWMRINIISSFFTILFS